MPGGDPSAVDPVVDAGRGHAQLGGQAGDRPFAWSQAGEHGGPAFLLASDAALADQGADLLVAEPAGPLGRPESLGVEDIGDLAISAARGGELGDAGEEGGVIRQLVQAGDGADGLPGGLVPAGPGDGDVGQLAVAHDADGDVLDQDPQQLLAVGLCR